MQFYHKFLNKKLSNYFGDIFKYNYAVYNIGTQSHDWLHLYRTRTSGAHNVLRHQIPELLNTFSKYLIDKINQSHRFGRSQAACREPAGSYDKTTRTAICLEHKTPYLLIRAPYTCIVIFWHIRNIPPWFRRVKLVVIPPLLYSSNICEILLCNRQLVVITHELI